MQIFIYLLDITYILDAQKSCLIETTLLFYVRLSTAYVLV